VVEADHARIVELTHRWTDAHRQVFEDRFVLVFRPMRWS